MIQPGIYAEVITLTSSVSIIGSGADRTILSFPGGSAATELVTAAGISNASIQNLTLLGSGSHTAFAASNGSTGIELSRTVIEGFNTAVTTDGSTTTLALKNNTIIGNVSGLLASNNAGVDVRNTIFAYNTGTALQYDQSAVLQLHQYNLYYANGTDLSPNNPGGGERFSNPLFLDYASGDFRTEPFSPVIDAGTPNDPVPPGAGLAIDIGHREQTPSSFFADDDYCSSCLNDGLIWGVDAFATIQEAVNAAAEDLDNLRVETPIQFTVGVNDGTYTESVVISSSIQLLGQAPDVTMIQGTSGPAVTLDAAVNAGVSNFALTGGGGSPIGVLISGGSNSIDLEYNLIKNNSVGISVTQRSTGDATFNTIISNTTGVELGRGLYAIEYTNPLLADPNERFQIYADECLDLNALYGYENVVCSDRGFLWLDMAHNILSGNTNGMVAIGGSVLFSDNNLLFNTTNYTNVYSGTNDIIDQDPLLTTANGYLQTGSPALDQAPISVTPPAGGGIRADIGWHELRAAPISIFMGQPDESLATESIGVGQVEYAVVQVITPTLPVTATLPSSWTSATLASPGEELTYWQVDYTPAGGDGYYRLYSRATDLLGNRETDISAWYDGAFVVDSGTPVVTMTVTTYGIPNWLLIEAEVNDYIGSSFDVDEIYFEINGERFEGRWNVEQWTADGSSPRTFRYFYQNTTGQTVSINYQAFAVDGAGNVGSSSQGSRSVSPGAESWVDTIAPLYITVTNPSPGQFIDTNTFLFEGVTWDAGAFFAPIEDHEIDSVTNGIELSFDGGVTWQTAFSRPTELGDPERTYADRIWSYQWTVPDGLDATTIPVRVRAIDNAGNFRSEIITVTVDTEAPREIRPYDLNWPVGEHVPVAQPITICWPQALDGSGWTQTASFTITDTETITGIFPSGNPCATQFNSEGAGVGFNAGLIDEQQNLAYQELGDWYGETDGDNGISSIQRDGWLAIQHNEWISATEFIDDDERPERTQNFWTSWDGYYPYIGWQGATWGPDGEMWIYLDIYSGTGTTQPLSGTVTLPFDADSVVHVFGTDSARQYNYNDGSGQWEFAWFLDNPESQIGEDVYEPEFAHNPELGETEVRIASDIGRVNNVINFDTFRLMAYAVDTTDNVWTTFPTANRLDGNFQYYYEWENIVGADDLQKLPTAARIPAVSFDLASDPAEQDQIGAGKTISYAVTLTSLEDDDEPSLQLQVDATAGLTYQSVSGATTHNCSGATSCTIDVPTIPANGTQVVTITALTAGDLSSISQISTTVQLESGLPILDANGTLVHTIDSDAPTVTIRSNPGRAIGRGLRVVRGTADDGNGSGVAYVEVSTDGTTWQTARGTESWRLALNVPDTPTWTLYARAVDYQGRVSSIATVEKVRDITPPQILFTPPTGTSRATHTTILLGGERFVLFEGTTTDSTPAAGQVETLSVQFDSESAAWQPGSIYAPQDDGSQSWAYAWQLPAEDGGTHQVRFRATDYGGNGTISDWQEIVVDTVAPAVTVSEYRPTVTEDRELPALSGTVTDGTGVNEIKALIYPETGGSIETALTVSNGEWSVVLDQQALGGYTILLAASDSAGNEQLLGPYTVTKLPFSNAAPVAVNDSISTTVGTAVTIDVLANDTDGDFDTLSISSISAPANGSAQQSNAQIVYTPNDRFVGDDSFTYTISDGFGGQSTATVTVTVTGSGDTFIFLPVIRR